ncbi:hypothetical protein L596_010531 [Steinernema carpocapsae]|uniref:Uncharacterized protein n=1 Tax=Steinernema carpocapsae TaxID=34508 RepID=A0A4U5PIU4_STECR|nr:hypothetical protein L596_010531 [Steinernema carpocapsae]
MFIVLRADHLGTKDDFFGLRELKERSAKGAENKKTCGHRIFGFIKSENPSVSTYRSEFSRFFSSYDGPTSSLVPTSPGNRRCSVKAPSSSLRTKC